MVLIGFLALSGDMVTLLVSNISWRDDPTSPKDQGQENGHCHIQVAQMKSRADGYHGFFDADTPPPGSTSMRLKVFAVFVLYSLDSADVTEFGLKLYRSE